MHRTYKTGLALTRQFGNVLAVRVAKMYLPLLICILLIMLIGITRRKELAHSQRTMTAGLYRQQLPI